MPISPCSGRRAARAGLRFKRRVGLLLGDVAAFAALIAERCPGLGDP